MKIISLDIPTFETDFFHCQNIFMLLNFFFWIIITSLSLCRKNSTPDFKKNKTQPMIRTFDYFFFSE